MNSKETTPSSKKSIGLWGVLGAAGTLLFSLAQTKPVEAASNLAAWLKVIGIDRVPAMFATVGADRWATIGGLLAAVVSLAAVAYIRLALRDPGRLQSESYIVSLSRIEDPSAPNASKGTDQPASFSPRWAVNRPDAFIGEFEFHARAEAGAPPQRDTQLGEALAYIALGRWGHSYADAFVAAFEGAKLTAPTTFHQAAHDQELTVWGKSLPNGVYQKIPSEHWLKHHVDEKALIENGVARTRWAGVHGSDGDAFDDLMVSRSEVERLWRPS